MPAFEHLPYPSRYNSLRLLNYNYASSHKLCAITLVADLDAVANAVRVLAQHNHIIAEGAGACPVACALSGAGPGKIVCIISGGNINLSTLSQLLSNEL